MIGPKLAFARTAFAAMLLTAAGSLGAPAVAVTGAAGAAAACPWNLNAPTASLNPYSTADTVSATATVRKGPYGECDPVTSYPPGRSIVVRCYVANSFGNTWSYIAGSGWVWDANLANGGSPYYCQF
ncbi:hypothetical protein [Streptomyces liangshanensis]|uniref:SH3 domain-containing protein n=1 Tax=Streptomyces liangshanensis TaxID=2717324 RepID=A0A6G9H673_9ACTN|nr:hypothetical protein [Streptomyces liangshanensis]QIQ06042.1 hypothetical protein HA039_30365 [Streptomyces liangshanensis]